MAEKFDDNKPMVNLVPPEALLAVAAVMTFGAKKYGAENWRNPPYVSATRIFASVLRHLYAWSLGNDTDDESGLPHLDHAASALMMLITKLKTQPGVDDRWTPPPFEQCLQMRGTFGPCLLEAEHPGAHHAANGSWCDCRPGFACALHAAREVAP